MNYKPLSQQTKWVYVPGLNPEQQAQALSTKAGNFIIFSEYSTPFSAQFKQALADIGFLQHEYHATQAFIKAYSKESAMAVLTLPGATLLVADSVSVMYSKNKENYPRYIDNMPFESGVLPSKSQVESVSASKFEPTVLKSPKSSTKKQKDSSDLLEFLRQESKKVGILETSYIPKAEEYFKLRKEAIDNSQVIDEIEVSSNRANLEENDTLAQSNEVLVESLSPLPLVSVPATSQEKSPEDLEYEAGLAEAMAAYQAELEAEEANISGESYEILDEIVFTDENTHHTNFNAFDLHRDSFSLNQRFGQNLDALILAEQAISRELSIEEKQQLALFSGWGAIDSYLIENIYHASQNPENYYKEIVMARYATYLNKSKNVNAYSMETLRAEYGHNAFFHYLDENFTTIFSPEVGSTVNASILNSHFTDLNLCNHLWETVKKAGFEGGYILEPATGHGHILGTIPQDILFKSKIVGVEKEIATHKIAQALFPDAKIYNSGFESLHVPRESFDCIVSNVPFGNYSVYDPVYNQKGLSIHDYFIVKSLASLKAGGVGVFLTSKYTLDSAFKTARNEIAKYGHFVGAIRLPEGSHRLQAGTDVEIDVLFFIGKGEEKISEPAYNWDYPEVVIDEDYKHYSKSMYWTDNPENMLGTCIVEKNRYGQHEFVVHNTLSPEAYAERLNTQLDVISQNMARVRKAYLQTQDTLRVEDKSEVQAPLMLLSEKEIPLSLHEKQGVLYIANEQGILETLEKVDSRIFESHQPMLLHYMRIKNAMLACLEEQSRDIVSERKDENVLQAREVLNSEYDSFVKKYGELNAKKNARILAKVDYHHGRVLALENVSEAHGKQVTEKADIFYKDVLTRPLIPTSFDSIEEALPASLALFGSVDLNWISTVTSKEKQEVESILLEKELAFRDPHTPNSWIPVASYLSGNVRTKLEIAENTYAFSQESYLQHNIRALQGVIPADIPSEDILVRVGASWIPDSVVQDFVKYLFDTKVNVEIHRSIVDGSYTTNLNNYLFFKSGATAKSTYGTSNYSFASIFDDLLNQRTIDIKIYNGMGKDKIVNPEKSLEVTQLAHTVANLIQEKFRQFLFGDPEREAEMVRIYNRKFNSFVAPTYDGQQLYLTGTNPTIQLRKNQKDAIARILYEPTTLLYHEVGTGKTFSLIAGAMESKKIGRASKPLIVVPKKIIGQFEQNAYKLYPNAKILVLNNEDVQRKNRLKTLTKVANNEWDIVIMADTTFKGVSVNPEFEKNFLEKMLDEYRWELNHTEEKSYTQKHIQKMIATFEKKIEEISDKVKQGVGSTTGITIDELGIDMLLIDEAHNYKNLAIAGVNSPSSQRAFDLYIKTRWLFDKLGEEKNVVFATGTPVSNSVLELYNLQRYLGNKSLVEAGIDTSNGWISQFLVKKTRFEPAPSGTGWRQKERYGLQNLNELIRMMRSTFMDVATADEIGLKRPENLTVNVVAEQSVYQQFHQKELFDRVKTMQTQKVDPREDNILKVLSEGRQLSLSHLITDHTYKDYISSKVNQCIENLGNKYFQTHDMKGTQLVFCDMATPKTENAGGIYSFIKNRLTEMGIPENKIAFIHDAKNDKQRDNLFEAVQEGKIRILLGSTQKMGEGANVQDRLVALHHLDPPYRPSDIEQRNGRMIRFGNINEEVQTFVYTTKDTFDVFMWDMLKRKAELFSRVLRGEISVREIDNEVDPTYAETLAITSGNKLLKDKVELEQGILEKKSMLRGLEGELRNAKSRTNTAKTNFQQYNLELKSLNELASKRVPTQERFIWDISKAVCNGNSLEGNILVEYPMEMLEREKMLSFIARHPMVTDLKASEQVKFQGIKVCGLPVSLVVRSDKFTEKISSHWELLDKPLLKNRAADIEEFLLQLDRRTDSMEAQIMGLKKEIEKQSDRVVSQRLEQVTQELSAIELSMVELNKQIAVEMQSNSGVNNLDWGDVCRLAESSEYEPSGLSVPLILTHIKTEENELDNAVEDELEEFSMELK